MVEELSPSSPRFPGNTPAKRQPWHLDHLGLVTIFMPPGFPCDRDQDLNLRRSQRESVS